MNRKYERTNKNAMTLADFIARKMEKEEQPMEKSQLSTVKNQRSFGLSTLLHFNNNDTLSSIRSHKYDKISLDHSQESRFGVLMQDARKEINDLRSKRLELQSEWKFKDTSFKAKKPLNLQQNEQEESQISEALDQSQVDVYNSSLDRPVYPKRYQEKLNSDDKFVQELRINILKRKGEQFLLHLKKYAMIRVHLQLKKWTQLCTFKQKVQKQNIRRVLCSWRDVTDKTVERLKLRQMILVRLKKRKQLQQMNTNVETYLNDL